MKKLTNIANKYASLILGIFLIALWEVAGYMAWLPKFIIPTPSEIVSALWTDKANLWVNSQVTLLQAFIGLGIGIVLAFILAILMDLATWLYRALYPLLIITQTIPTVAIAPVLVLLLGYDMTPKIVLVVLTTLFPIIISILNGFANSDQDAVRLLQLMGANRWQVLVHVKLPNSMPFFFSGLRVSVSYAFVSSVVAEWLGGFEGLGVYMIQTKKAFAYDRMFAVIVLISLISLIFMWLVSKIERILIPWLYQDQKNNVMKELFK
ncbi:ABC transporter permease [Fundicoccus ignavus]|uniref:ABC transporter permease subunit n=1 Tax=Fundicoccus ignavus TaxID=2664442 RepID=A0A844CAJ1_9LACT|nr:ABC transporter permease [Fundicoccus ignavus]MRJ47843.1 ABC transporter permease subunit [Fundicoccus ignavus]